MIFTDRKITIRNGKSSIDAPVIVYRGDYEVSIRFTIMESKFRFKSGVNLVDSEKASFGQLAILAPYGGNVFSEEVKCEDGTVTFTLTKKMIDQLEEVGLYSFQIRLFDYYRESRVSIPPVEFGIEVREPVASEDHDNSVNNAIVGYSIAKVVDPSKEDVGDTFNPSGQYNKTKWETGDRISEGKLNKIEDALDTINQNEMKDVAALDKRISTNFNVLEATKAGTDDVNKIQSQVNNLVLGAVGDGNNAEVIQARGSHTTLNSRFDSVENNVNRLYNGINGIVVNSAVNMAYENACSYRMRFDFPSSISLSNVSMSFKISDILNTIEKVSIKVAVNDSGNVVHQSEAVTTKPVFNVDVSHTFSSPHTTNRIYLYVWVQGNSYPSAMQYIIESLAYTINNAVYTPSVGTIYAISEENWTITHGVNGIYDLNYSILDINDRMINIDEANIKAFYEAEHVTYDLDTSVFSKASTGIYGNESDIFKKGTLINSITVPITADTADSAVIRVRLYDIDGALVSTTFEFTVNVTSNITEQELIFEEPITCNSKDFRIFLSSSPSVLLFTKPSTKRILIATAMSTTQGYMSYKAKILKELSISEKYATKNEIPNIDIIPTSSVYTMEKSIIDYYGSNGTQSVSSKYYCMNKPFDRNAKINSITLNFNIDEGHNTSDGVDINLRISNGTTYVEGPYILHSDVTEIGNVDVTFDNLNLRIQEGCYLCFAYTTSTAKYTYDKSVNDTIITMLTGGDFGAKVAGSLNYKVNFEYTTSLDVSLDARPDRVEVENMINDVTTGGYNNRLYGKKLVAIGDSMVQGHSIARDKGWVSMIANRNNMTYVNYGINGTYMTDKTYGSNAYAGVVDRYVDMDDDADYIIIFAGTNDAAAQITMGDDNSTNKSEFKGALNVLCSGLLTKYPDKRIMFITPYHRRDNYLPYVEAIETICAKYSIPVFNNAKNGGICWTNDAQLSALTLGDVLHLNLAGMEYASYKYEAFLRTL